MKNIQIRDLSQNKTQKLNKMSDKEISKIVGGLDPGPGGHGCPMSGIIGYMICGY